MDEIEKKINYTKRFKQKKIKIKRMKIKIEIPNCLSPNLIITKKTLGASLIF
jgi:hypothetical protein